MSAPAGKIGIGLLSNGFFTIGDLRVQSGAFSFKVNQNTEAVTVRDILTGQWLFISKSYADFWDLDADIQIASLDLFHAKINSINT